MTRLVLLACAALALAACSHDNESLSLPAGRAVVATPALDPPVHFFGDNITARLELVVDRRRLDPDRIRLRPRFHPYERVGEIDVERTDHGDLTRLRFAATLRCLGPACLPRRLSSGAAGDPTVAYGERRAFRLQPARLVYQRGGREQLLRIVRWPSLEVVSRINVAQMQTRRFVFRSTVAPLPAVTYVVPPLLLAALLALGAMLLLIPAAVLLRRRALARRPEPVEEEPELLPLERALQLVEWARERPNGEDRRRALEVLAVALDDVERADDAETARAIAWAPSSPSGRAAEMLVQRVRETDGRR